MSNLQTARQAIQAEITHAKEGMAYYTARVKSLEQALEELNIVEESATVSAKGLKSQGKVRGAKKSARLKLSKQSGKSGAASEVADLPSTGGDYWTNLVTEEPQHSSEILRAAIGRLGFVPSPEQVKKLSQRMTFALNAFVKVNKIQDSGSGRDRVFFKKS